MQPWVIVVIDERHQSEKCGSRKTPNSPIAFINNELGE